MIEDYQIMILEKKKLNLGHQIPPITPPEKACPHSSDIADPFFLIQWTVWTLIVFAMAWKTFSSHWYTCIPANLKFSLKSTDLPVNSPMFGTVRQANMICILKFTFQKVLPNNLVIHDSMVQQFCYSSKWMHNISSHAFCSLKIVSDGEVFH